MKDNTDRQDEQFMQLALDQAALAQQHDEVPVGAVIVRDGSVIGSGFNQPIASRDPTAHAEVIALRDAAERENNYRLSGATLYVTIEPCTMCVGAMMHARIARLVFGAREPRAGVVCSQQSLLDSDFYNHKMQWREGVLAEQCGDLMSQFFKRRR